jgi:hypothetical protein
MPNPKTKSDNLQSVEKLIVLNLAENKPQTKRKTAKAISKYYKSTWDAFRSLEGKKLIRQAATITYNGIEYPCYWLTDEGIIMALTEGASPERLLTRTKSLYPEAKITHAFLEIVPSFHPEVMKIVYSSAKGKGKIGVAEVILLFLSQPAIAIDDETVKKLTAVLKKYPDEYNKFKTAIREMINQLSQLIKE